MEPDRPQYERPAACVIAQQYSSANLVSMHFNPLNTELNTICHFLALLGAHPILHVSRIRVNSRTEKFGARLKKKLFYCLRVLLKNLGKPKIRVSLCRANGNPEAVIVSLSVPAVHPPMLNLKWT